ncbi:hypothetical protein [Hymenobacter metallilatus]|uniref:GOLD domain-containing protein n=1 Tax=Hymenobacter metallilatus TaxID=2493666 RepID=A0A3R9NNZ1_9BACT|nr:hypothetical protein [Hymenobacter metallilatus]RSK33164.1 hypothetical protein EI290_10640 [Hymenobacter metallilatus]
MNSLKINSIRLLALCLGLTGAATSCFPTTDEATCSEDVVGSVATVSSARTGRVGTPVPVSYTVSIPNGCGQFQGLREQREDKKVYLVPTVHYEGCTCPQVVSDYRGTYQFTAAEPGTYVLLFPNTTQTLTDTITIQ